MAGVKISELVILETADIELTDEIIVNDKSILTTKRATLQTIRDLANQNIDDLAEPGAGSGVTGDLEVSGDITAEGDITGQNLISENDITFGGDLIDGLGNTITDFTTLVTDDELIQLFNTTAATEAKTIDAKIDLGDVGAVVSDDHYIIFRDTAFGFDSSFTNTGLKWNNDQGGILNANFFAGDGSLLTNIAYADASGISDSATRATRSIWSQEQQVVSAVNTGDYYMLFGPTENGVDSVNTNSALTYNLPTGTLSAAGFVGDGSGLTGVTATSFSTDTIRPNDISTFSALETSFNLLLHPSSNIDGVTGDGLLYDSVNVVQNLKYFPSTVTLSGSLNLANGKASELFLDGVADVALKTKAQEASGTSHYLMMRSKGWDAGDDSDLVSLTSGLTYDVSSGPGVLFSPAFQGDGYLLSKVFADSASAARTIDVDPTINGTYLLGMYPSSGGFQQSYANTGVTFNHDTNALTVTGGIQHVFNVTNSGSDHYVFTSSGAWFPAPENDPVLYLRRGETYTFNMSATGHPLYIKTIAGVGTNNQYSIGVTGQGSEVSSVVFAVPMSAPSTLYYACGNHGAMGATINIV